MLKYLLVLILLNASCLAYAAIYVQEDARGNTVYSDTPLNKKAKVVTITEPKSSSLNTSPSVKQNDKLNLPIIPERKSYTTFFILSPKNEETIQNKPELPVSVKVEPELQPGDMIQLLIDGKPMGPPSQSTNIVLGQIERGTHQLTAVILNKDKSVIKQSNTITIYIHRSTVNSPARQQISESLPLHPHLTLLPMTLRIENEIE